MTVGEKDPLKLRVFVDKSVVEVFAKGHLEKTVRVYPGRPDATGVSLKSVGVDTVVSSLDAWQMKSIW